MTRRPTSPSTLPDDDDLLQEILLRLPPLPSSLPRASLVCTRWRRLLSDPAFLRRFRARHRRNPPLLGFFHRDRSGAFLFVPTLDPPDRIPAARFSLDPQGSWGRWPYVIPCRGLLLCWNRSHEEFLVFDPMSGDRRRIPFPQGKERSLILIAAVVPADDDRRLFRIVVLLTDSLHWKSAHAAVYSSDSGVWADRVSTVAFPSIGLILRPGTIVGNAIHWLLDEDCEILRFDLDSLGLAIVAKPPGVVYVGCLSSFKCQIMPADDGGSLGLAVLSQLSIQFWVRETVCGGGPAKWTLRKTVRSDKFLPPGCLPLAVAGFCEENNVIFLRTDGGVFMIHLDSMQSRMVHEKDNIHHAYPYSSF